MLMSKTLNMRPVRGCERTAPTPKTHSVGGLETIWAAGLQRPRIEDLRVRCEVLHVAGDDVEAVALGGGRE